MARARKTETPDDTPAAETPAAPQVEIKLDESGMVASYANFCRCTGTPEELIIDFALNSQPMGPPPEEIKLKEIRLSEYRAAVSQFKKWMEAEQ